MKLTEEQITAALKQATDEQLWQAINNRKLEQGKSLGGRQRSKVKHCACGKFTLTNVKKFGRAAHLTCEPSPEGMVHWPSAKKASA